LSDVRARADRAAGGKSTLAAALTRHYRNNGRKAPVLFELLPALLALLPAWAALVMLPHSASPDAIAHPSGAAARAVVRRARLCRPGLPALLVLFACARVASVVLPVCCG
jgi:hypothetical protein